MNPQTTPMNSSMNTGASHDTDRCVRPDADCWATASKYLTELIGSPPDDLRWDDTHHLQGHGHLQGRELIVIAARDDQHQTVVLTAEDWDAVRRASAEQRHDLLNVCAIADHNQLVAVLGDHRTTQGSRPRVPDVTPGPCRTTGTLNDRHVARRTPPPPA